MAIDGGTIQRERIGDNLRRGNQNFSTQTRYEARSGPQRRRCRIRPIEEHEDLQTPDCGASALMARGMGRWKEWHASRLKPFA